MNKLTKKQKKVLVRIIASAFLLAAAYAVTELVSMPWWAALIIFLVPYAIIGWDILCHLLHGTHDPLHHRRGSVPLCIPLAGQ